MKFQLLIGNINLAGSRDSVTHRGPDNPMTYPETLVLQVIHGGAEHVYDLVDVGEVERDPAEEYNRLASIYPAELIRTLFPPVAGNLALPQRDDKLPTSDEVEAAREAAAAATAKARAQRGRRKTPASPADGAVPDLDNLPAD